MPFQVQCPCGKVYMLPESLCGKQARCKVCKQLFVVPDISEAYPTQQTPTQQTPTQQTPVQNPSGLNAATSDPLFKPSPMGIQQPLSQQPLSQQPLSQQPLSQQPQPSSAPFTQQGYQPVPQQPQIPNAMGMPQAVHTSPLHPTGIPNSRLAAKADNKKLWIIVGGSVGGLALVLLLVIFLWNGNPDAQGNAKLADGESGNNGANPNSQYGQMASSENGLFEQIKFHDLGPIRKTWVFSKNKKTIAVCTHKPKAATVTIIDLANPSVTESETIEGRIKLLDISNDAQYLAYEIGDKQQLLARNSGQIISPANFVEFTGDSKHGLSKYGNFALYCFSLESRRVVWSRLASSSGTKLSSNMKNWLSFSAGDFTRGDFLDDSKKKTTLSMLYGEYENSSDLRYVVVTKNEKLVVADLANQKKVAEIDGLKFPKQAKIWSSISSNGDYAVIMQAETETSRFVSLIDLQKGAIVDKLPNYTGTGMFMSDDGNHFVTLVQNGVQIWKLKRPDGAQPSTSSIPESYFVSLPMRQRLMSAYDPIIMSLNKALAVRSETIVPPEKKFSNSIASIERTVKRSNNRIEGMAFANSYILSGNQRFLGIGVGSQSMARGTITVWDTQSGFLPEVVQGSSQDRIMGISHDGNLVAIKDLRNAGNTVPHKVTVYDREENVIKLEINGIVGNRAFFSSDNTKMLMEYQGRVGIWDLKTKTQLSSGSVWAKKANDVDRDFKKLVEITNDSIVTYDIATQQQIATAKRPSGSLVDYGCISMETQRIATISNDRISVYHYGTNKLIGELLLDGKLVSAKVKLSRDGSKLICYSGDWEKQHHGFIASVTDNSVNRIGSLPIPKGSFCRDFELSDDGNRMYSICRNGTEFGHVVFAWKLK